MRKLKLAFDELRVESFETSAVSGEAGTVRGHDHTEHCPTEVCTGEFGLTCRESCGGTCDFRCFDTDELGCIVPLTPPRWTEYYVDGICAIS